MATATHDMTRQLTARTAPGRPSLINGGAALFLVVVLLLLAACGGASSGSAVSEGAAATASADRDDPVAAGPVVVESLDGREVRIDDTSRIVPLFGNLAEVVFDLGFGDAVVGRDVSATLAEAADLPVVTEGHEVSAESVLSLRPTLVLADEDTGPPEALDHIRNVGVPVVVLERPVTIDDIDGRIAAVAEILGTDDAGAALVAATRSRIADVQDTIPPDAPSPRVAFLYVRGSASVYLIGGPGAGSDAMIDAAGGIDAGTAIGLDDPFTPITSEAMVEAAPDVLLLTTSGVESVGGVDGLVSIPGIAQTPAGRERRVVTVEDGLLFSFGSRTPDALAALITGIHGTVPAGTAAPAGDDAVQAAP